jgi:hypothetical protein
LRRKDTRSISGGFTANFQMIWEESFITFPTYLKYTKGFEKKREGGKRQCNTEHFIHKKTE